MSLRLIKSAEDYFRDRFPSSEGWKFYRRYNWRKDIIDLVIQRQSENLTLKTLVKICDSERKWNSLLAMQLEDSKRLSGKNSVVVHLFVFGNGFGIRPNLPNVECRNIQDLYPPTDNLEKAVA